MGAPRGSPANVGDLHRSALAFDDALALLDRRLRSAAFDAEQENLELERLEAQVAEMDKTCEAHDPSESPMPEIRAQRTRITIYKAELKRLRERIRLRANHKARQERGSSQVSDESRVALALAGAHRVADELLHGSSEAAEELARQKEQLAGRMDGALGTQAALSSLLGSVQRTRANRTLLLTMIAALCVCLLLYYWLLG